MCSSSAPEAAAATAADAAPDAAVTFFTDFVVSQVDYHTLLLQEANKKHNVPLNVPPQLNPPTDEHRCVYTDALGMRMQEPERHFCFQPLHGPPPRLPEMEPKIEKRGLPPPEPKKKAAAPVPPQAGGAGATDKPFQCSVCQKQFRMRPAAQQHLESQHAGDASAKIIELTAATPAPAAAAPSSGSGSAAAPAAAPAAASPAAVSKLSEGPNPLLALMANEAVLASDAPVGLAAPREPPVMFALPTDDDIDSLITSTWDEVGKKVLGAGYRAAASFIVSDTDAEVAQKMAAAGTNTFGSAPRSAAAAVGGLASADAGVAAAGARGTAAASTMPAVGTRASLTVGGFSSPFVNASNYNAQMPAGYSTANRAEARKFKCEHCSKAYRLLDALLNHYEIEHGAEPSEAHLAELKALDNPHVTSLRKAADSAASKSAEAAAAAAAAASSESADSASSAAPAAAAPARREALPVVDVAAHVRAATNMVLVGQVRELRFGYVKTDPVAQLLIQVDTPRCNGANNKPPGASPDEKENAEQAAVALDEGVETEYFTVRCFGDQFTDLLKPSLEAGSTVLVTGTLKLNYHVVPEVGDAFPFPYIKVVPPYGDVVPLAGV